MQKKMQKYKKKRQVHRLCLKKNRFKEKCNDENKISKNLNTCNWFYCNLQEKLIKIHYSVKL